MSSIRPDNQRSDGAICRGWQALRQHFRSGILHRASWMMGGRTYQMVGRVVYFILVAHVLGPHGYGTYIACAALLTATSPFAALGSGDVMTKYVARDRGLLGTYFGNAILITLSLGAVLTGIALLLRPRLLPSSASATLLVAVAVGEIAGSQLTALCAQVFVALEQARKYALMLSCSTTLRVIAAVALALTIRSPLWWAYLYAASGLLATTIGIIAVSRTCARPRLRLGLVIPSMREGFHFATATASQSVYNDIDKVMLAKMSTVDAAAIYAVAYRFVEGAMLPIRSIAAATYPEFFRRGIHGVTSTFEFARSIVRRSAVYGLVIAVCLFAAAGVVPMIMGPAYARSAVALRYLCLLPFLKSVHAFLTDTLTGADYQWQRSLAQCAVALFNILVNLWIIAAFSWRGAAWSSLATDGLLVVLLYLIIRHHLRRERGGFAVAAPRSVLVTGEE